MSLHKMVMPCRRRPLSFTISSLHCCHHVDIVFAGFAMFAAFCARKPRFAFFAFLSPHLCCHNVFRLWRDFSGCACGWWVRGRGCVWRAYSSLTVDGILCNQKCVQKNLTKVHGISMFFFVFYCFLHKAYKSLHETDEQHHQQITKIFKFTFENTVFGCFFFRILSLGAGKCINTS